MPEMTNMETETVKTRVKKTTQDRIDKARNDIAQMEADIKEKKALIRKLTDQKEAEDTERLLDAVEESGKSVDDVIAMLQMA